MFHYLYYLFYFIYYLIYYLEINIVQTFENDLFAAENAPLYDIGVRIIISIVNDSIMNATRPLGLASCFPEPVHICAQHANDSREFHFLGAAYDDDDGRNG